MQNYFDVDGLASALNHARVASYMDDDRRHLKLVSAVLNQQLPMKRSRKVFSFIEHAKRELSRNPAAYNHSIKVLKLYQENVIDLRDAIRRIVILYTNAPQVLQSLNVFLPHGWRLNMLMDGSGTELLTPEDRETEPTTALSYE